MDVAEVARLLIRTLTSPATPRNVLTRHRFTRLRVVLVSGTGFGHVSYHILEQTVCVLRQAVQLAHDPFGCQQRKEQQQENPVIPQRRFFATLCRVFWWLK